MNDSTLLQIKSYILILPSQNCERSYISASGLKNHHLTSDCSNSNCVDEEAEEAAAYDNTSVDSTSASSSAATTLGGRSAVSDPSLMSRHVLPSHVALQQLQEQQRQENQRMLLLSQRCSRHSLSEYSPRSTPSPAVTPDCAQNNCGDVTPHRVYRPSRKDLTYGSNTVFTIERLLSN